MWEFDYERAYKKHVANCLVSLLALFFVESVVAESNQEIIKEQEGK